MTYEFDGQKLRLEKQAYSNPWNLCLLSYCDEGVYCKFTTNIRELPPYMNCIDVNNLGYEAVDFLVSIGAGKPTGVLIKSGYCIYPVFKFNKEFIDNLDGFYEACPQ